MLQMLLQSGSSLMLVSFCSRDAFSAGLRTCAGVPESPQSQPHSSFPQDLRETGDTEPETKEEQEGRGEERVRKGKR